MNNIFLFVLWYLLGSLFTVLGDIDDYKVGRRINGSFLHQMEQTRNTFILLVLLDILLYFVFSALLQK